MSATPRDCRVTILVKALPQRSSKHGETVCCAGVTPEGELKRLFPVRFRHLKDSSVFGRWDNVDFKYVEPTHDRRRESCRVFEDTIVVGKPMRERERAPFLEPLVCSSVKAASERGDSLALLRPLDPVFSYKRKPETQVEQERQSFKDAASQMSFFDEELAALEPCPFEFRFHFRDSEQNHNYANADWEAYAMYFNSRKRGDSIEKTLSWMDETFNGHYRERGMLFAVGNQAKRPQTWQLLGVLRVDETSQISLL